MNATTLHGLLDAAAHRSPGAVAVEDGDRTITYGELAARTDQLASALAASGVVPGDRVGLYLPKSIEAVIGLYGIMKTGAAYVPLDVAAPVRRLAYIAADADISVLVSCSEQSSSWDGLVGAGAPLVTVVCLGEEPGTEVIVDVVSEAWVSAHSQDPPTHRSRGDDLAYVLYTSGSTGVPKGVMLTHSNGLAFVRWATGAVEVTSDDRLSSHAPFHFDLSVFDLFVAAAAGAALVLVPRETSVFPAAAVDFVASARISVWYSVPSILTMMLLRGGLERAGQADLRAVLFAGEVFPTQHLRACMAALPGVRFWNLYGPTETNVCTYYEVLALPADQTAPIPIGRAIDDVDVFAVTDEGRVAGVGEVGELLVRGSTVMVGYLGDPERTARNLVPDPRPGVPPGHVYRTGDLVQLTAGGDYTFLGRRDAQIKSRGYRIELGDIEAAINAHPAVIESAVVAIPDEIITNRLRAHVAVRPEQAVTERELVSFCRDRLPPYMIPGEVLLAAALPRSSTGKIDRRALSTSTPT